MSNKIVLISEDVDFFEYIKAKLALRKSDELFCFSFDSVLDKLHLIKTAVIIINSENANAKTLELLSLFDLTPIIVFAYNFDDEFRVKCFQVGMFDFLTPLVSDKELQARLLPALAVSSLLQKNQNYRDILVKNNIITVNNEVYIDYGFILDKELEVLSNSSRKSAFLAISPDDKTKFMFQSNKIETIILNNIRENDILMNYAPNKYFLILHDADLLAAQKIWNKISNQFPQKIYAGIAQITNQSKQQLINEGLNKLHQAIANDREFVQINQDNNSLQGFTNFKMFKQEFEKKIENTITPVFYQVQQKYSSKLAGVKMDHVANDGFGAFYIKGKTTVGCLKITSPGFSKINIDISLIKDSDVIDNKRIVLEPEELEQGLLGDLLEQFICEYRDEV